MWYKLQYRDGRGQWADYGMTYCLRTDAERAMAAAQRLNPASSYRVIVFAA